MVKVYMGVKINKKKFFATTEASHLTTHGPGVNQ